MAIDVKNEAMIKKMLQDGTVFLDEYSAAVARMRPGKSVKTLVEDAFRCIHSLKSEASFCGFSELVGESHRLETFLEGLRARDLAEEDIEQLESGKDRLYRLWADVQIDQEPVGQPAGDSGEDTLCQRWDFSDFEISLIREAKIRGERFYRLHFTVDPTEEMPRTRAVLVVSQLEQVCNVIQVTPDLRDESQDSNREFSVLLSSRITESRIYQAMDVDLLSRVSLVSLDPKLLLAPYESLSTWEDPMERVPLSLAFLDGVLDDLDELKLVAHREGVSDRVKKKLAALESRIKSSRKIPLVTRLQGYEEYVKRLSGELGKKVRFQVQCGPIEIDRMLFDKLDEMLKHLIRNALDHGLESPEERIAAGKSDTGILALRAREEGATLVLDVFDDGRGVPRKLLARRAQDQGLFRREDEPELLELLSAPGLSSKDEPDEHSGRGFGLDLVNRLISQTDGASLEVTSKRGKGSRFRISLESLSSLVDILFFRSGDTIVGVNQRFVHSLVSLNSDRVSRSEDGSLLYEDSKLYNLMGPLSSQADMDPLGLLIQAGEEQIVLPIKEILYRQMWPEDRLVLVGQGTRGLYRLKSPSREPEGLYLIPSLLCG